MHVADVAANLDPDKSRLAVARVMIALGSKFDWDSDTLQDVFDAVRDVAAESGLPSIVDRTDHDGVDDALEFWEKLR